MNTFYWVITIAGIVALLIALLSWITLLLWNWLCPSIFGLRQINIWEAAGLLALATLLFRSGNVKN